MEEDFQGGDKVLNEIGLGLKMTKKYENGKKKVNDNDSEDDNTDESQMWL